MSVRKEAVLRTLLYKRFCAANVARQGREALLLLRCFVTQRWVSPTGSCVGASTSGGRANFGTSLCFGSSGDSGGYVTLALPDDAPGVST